MMKNFLRILFMFALLAVMPQGAWAEATLTQPDGYYIQGAGFDGTSATYLHYKMKKVTGTTNQYYIDVLGTTYTLSGVHSFNKHDISDTEAESNSLYINPLGKSFNVVRVSGSTKTIYGTSGTNYKFTNTDPNYGTSNTAAVTTLGSNTWQIGSSTENGDNGGMYHFVITVDESGAVTNWQYTSNPKKVVAYKLGGASSWTTTDYLYCSRTDVNASGNYKGYNQNFDGASTCTKDEEFAFLMAGDYWFKANENKSSKTYTKNTAYYLTNSGNSDINSEGTQENLKFEYATGAYDMQFNPTQDEYQLWGVNGGGTTIPSHIYIIGNAVGTEGATTNTFTSWNPDNAQELIYDAEEGCWKGTVTFTTGSDKDFRFLYNKDVENNGVKNGLNLNLGEDANTPGNGGDTWTNNKVAYNGKSSDGTNVTFYGHGEVSGSYTVRFYMEAQEGKRFQDARTYWYTLEANNIPDVTLAPESQTFAAGTTEQALTATETNGTMYAWSAYTGTNTVAVDANTNRTDYTAGEGNFGTLKYENGNIYLVKNGTFTLLAENSNTVTIAISPVVANADNSTYSLAGATRTYTYTFTVLGGSTEVGTISPDGGFYVNKVQVTITPASGKTIYYALGGKQASASTSDPITAATKVWVSTPGAISISDGTNTEVSKAFDFTYSTSDNYLNYYHNGKSQVTNTKGGKDANTVFFQTDNTDTHVYAWDYNKDSYTKSTTGNATVETNLVKLSNDLPGASLAEVNSVTLNTKTFYYYTTLKSSLTTYDSDKSLSTPAVSFIASRGSVNSYPLQAYQTKDIADITENSFYVYSSSNQNTYTSANGATSYTQNETNPEYPTTFNNYLSSMAIHYDGYDQEQTITKLKSDASAADKNIIFFEKPSTWGSVYCYAYADSNNNRKWPGIVMNAVPGIKDVYYILLNKTLTNVIFNDKGSNQYPGKDQNGWSVTTNCLYTSSGQGSEYTTTRGNAKNTQAEQLNKLSQDNEGKNIVFFEKPSAWGTPTCYAYDDKSNNDWNEAPSMTQVGSSNIYYVTLGENVTYKYLIFKDNSNHRTTPDQAAGYVLVPGGYYTTDLGSYSGPTDLYLDKTSAQWYIDFLKKNSSQTASSTRYPNGKDYYSNVEGDMTILLDPKWGGDSQLSSDGAATDWSGRTTSYVGPDESTTDPVNDLPKLIASSTELSQSVVGLDANSYYTVQAIVNTASTGKVTLTLKSTEDGTKYTTATASGTGPAAGSLITKSGRIEKLTPETDRIAGWFKLEAKAKPSTNGVLTIALKGTADFSLADVTLLKDANTEAMGHMWTTAPLTNENTYVDYSERTTHNAYSFFDRGQNPNGLVAADDHSVIANANRYMAEDLDYKSKVLPAPYNIVAFDGTTNKGCNHLYLTEQAQDGTMYDASNTENGFFLSGWTFATPVQFQATQVTFDRVMPNHFSTIVMPFEISADDFWSKFGATTAYKFSKVKDNKVYVNTISGAVPANTPVIVKGKGDGNKFTFGAKDVAITSTKAPTTTGDDGSSFIGQFEYLGGVKRLNQDASGNTEYINYNYRPSDGKFMLFNDGGDVKPFRAYLHYKYTTVSSTGTEQKAKALMNMIIDDFETTGIEDLDTVVVAADGPVYSIDGKRVAAHLEGASLTKGIYIHNGKKFIVK